MHKNDIISIKQTAKTNSLEFALFLGTEFEYQVRCSLKTWCNNDPSSTITERGIKMSIQEAAKPVRPAPSSPPKSAQKQMHFAPAQDGHDEVDIVSVSDTQDNLDRQHSISDENITSGLNYISRIEELMDLIVKMLENRHTPAESTATPNPLQQPTAWYEKVRDSKLGSYVWPTTASDPAALLAWKTELELWAEYFLYSYQLREIVRTSKDWQRVLCVMASKGGAGKTPLIVYLAALFAFATSTTNLVVEANENDGTVKSRYNLNRDSQAILSDVVKNTSLVEDHLKATKSLGKFEQTTVWALLSSENATDNMFSMADLWQMFNVLRPSFSVVWGDTGNGNRHATNELMFLESDVVLFPALAGNSDTHGTVIATMINLHKAGHQKKLQERSTIVISAAKESEGHTVEMFLEIFRIIAAKEVKPRYDYEKQIEAPPLWTTDPDQLLRDLGFSYDPETNELTGENILLVRHSDWIDGGNIVSVRPEDVGLSTIVDYLKVAVRIFSKPTQDKSEKKAEIERRMKERNETIQLATKEPSIEEVTKRMFADNPENIQKVLAIAAAAQVEYEEARAAESE
ncbi:MAG TPA: hypothetical protein VF281_03380 [Candidatus Saccharimonadales bacterium]